MKTAKKNVLFLLLLIAVAAVTFIYGSMKAGEGGSREVAAIVNGKPIYTDDIARELATIPAGQRQNISELEVLDFLIEKRLLLEAAKEEGIIVTKQDIDELYRKYANPAYFDIRATEALIAEQNLSEDEFIERLAEQAAINKLMEKKVDAIALTQRISSSEVEQIYESSFKGRNVSFEEAEEDIVLFILQKRKENIRTSYINSLKMDADITPVMQP